MTEQPISAEIRITLTGLTEWDLEEIQDRINEATGEWKPTITVDRA